MGAVARAPLTSDMLADRGSGHKKVLKQQIDLELWDVIQKSYHEVCFNTVSRTYAENFMV